MIPINDLLNFIKMLPYSFLAERISTKNSNNVDKFRIYCNKCNNLEVFNVKISFNELVSELSLSSICCHLNIQVYQEIVQNSFCLFVFHSELFNVICDGKIPAKHSFRIIGKRVYKNSNSNQILKEYLENKIYSHTQLSTIEKLKTIHKISMN